MQVHIQLPMVSALCRKLDIDYAPALSGFDIRGGRSVPSIDGVVICVEHEAALRAAYDEDMAQKAEQAKVKRMAEAEKSWRELLRALLTRVRLARSYSGPRIGGGNSTDARQQPGNAEGEAAAMLAHDAANGKRQGRGGGNGGGGGSRGLRNTKGAGRGRKSEENAVQEYGADVKIEEI